MLMETRYYRKVCSFYNSRDQIVGFIRFSEFEVFGVRDRDKNDNREWFLGRETFIQWLWKCPFENAVCSQRRRSKSHTFLGKANSVCSVSLSSVKFQS